MAKVMTPTYQDDLTGKPLRDSDRVTVSFSGPGLGVSDKGHKYSFDTHKENLKELINQGREKGARKQLPGRKEGSTNGDGNADAETVEA